MRKKKKNAKAKARRETALKKVEKQTRILKEILEDTKKTKRYILWLRFLSILKVLIIAIPIILGLIYIPPQLKRIAGFFQRQIQSYQEKLPQLFQADDNLED